MIVAPVCQLQIPREESAFQQLADREMTIDNCPTPAASKQAVSISLKTKTLLIIAAIMTLIVVTADQLELWRARTERAYQLTTRAMLVGGIQAGALVQPMWDLATDQVRAMLEALRKDPDFLGAAVTSADGKPVASEGDVELSDGYIESKFDITRVEGSGKKLLGYLRLRLATANLERASREQFQLSILKLTIMLIAIVGSIYAALRLITKPLEGMTRVMSKLAEGELELAIPAVDRHDEIGAMARAVSVFKANAIDRARLESQQIDLKRRTEQERRASMDELATIFEETVRNVVNTASATGADLEKTAGSMASNAERASTQVGLVVNASNSATTNVQSVADAAEELSASISEISQQVTRSARIASASGGGSESNQCIGGKSHRSGSTHRQRSRTDQPYCHSNESSGTQCNNRSRACR